MAYSRKRDIGEVFVNSVCNVPCMLSPYVCTYGVMLRLRLAEEYQLVQNKQTRKTTANLQVSRVIYDQFRTVKYRSR